MAFKGVLSAGSLVCKFSMQALQEYHALTNGIFNQHRGTMRLGRIKSVQAKTKAGSILTFGSLFGAVWTLGFEDSVFQV